MVSPEVSQDGTVTFRILAPNAEKVQLLDDIGVMLSGGGPGPLSGSSVPAVPPGTKMPQGGLVFTKNADGLWEASSGPLPPGAYRYAFQVDGVRVLDPVNTHTSESNTLVWSMFSVSGSPLMDTRTYPTARLPQFSTTPRYSKPPGGCTSTYRRDMKSESGLKEIPASNDKPKARQILLGLF